MSVDRAAGRADPIGRPRTTLCLATGLAIFLAALFAMMLARPEGHVAMIWYATAIAMAALAGRPLRDGPAMVLTCVVALMLAHLVVGDSAARSLSATFPGVVEAILGALALRAGGFATASRPSPAQLGRLLVTGSVLPQFAGATIGASLLATQGFVDFEGAWVSWFTGSAIGSATLLPLLIVSHHGGLRQFRRASTVALCAVAAAVTFGAMSRLPHCFVFVSLPAFLAATRRTLAPTALVAAISSITATLVIATGWLLPTYHGGNDSIVLVYLPIAAALMPSLFLAASGERSFEVTRALEASEARARLAAGALETSNRLLSAAEQLANFGHWRFDLPTIGMMWSPGLDTILRGFAAPPAATFEAFLFSHHAGDREKLRQALDDLLRRGQPFRMDLRALNRTGGVRHAIIHGQPEYDAAGVLIAAFGTYQDVTERVLLEESFRHAQRMESIGRLAAGVAHDFNNVLQAVTASIVLARDTIDSRSRGHEHCAVALAAAERGSSLTDNLLAYARKQILVPRRIAPSQVLRDVGALLKRTLDPRIDVVVLSDDEGFIEVDPGNLQTALLNLGINAGQAMPEGGSLTLQSWNEAPDEPFVVMSVSDTGTGMDADTLARAAEPFFTTKGAHGSGLGLPMVKGFVEQSGGELEILSRPGYGTSITMRLPSVAAAEPNDYREHAPERLAGRVLLVDDTADVLLSTASLLEASGLDVVTEDNPMEAIDRLREERPFDVLVTDFAMPECNGVELIRTARALAPGLPAILMTGYIGLKDVPVAPPVEVLQKPFRCGDLVAAIARAMSAKPATGDAALPGRAREEPALVP